jgi:septal ring factor EnvC (AmiA/AmiB activator)
MKKSFNAVEKKKISRHCEERSDEAISQLRAKARLPFDRLMVLSKVEGLRSFQSLAMTLTFFIIFVVSLCAEEIYLAQEAPKTVTAAVKSDTVARATPVAAMNSSQEAVINAKIEKLKGEIADIKAKNEEIIKTADELKAEVRGLEEGAIEIKTISSDLEAYKEKLIVLEEKYRKDKEKIDKSIAEFDGMKDDLKQKTDKLAGWNDILDVLKKEIDNNELEVARIKKSISEMKSQYGDDDNVLNVISRWPYLSLTALVVGIAAFVAAVAIK